MKWRRDRCPSPAALERAFWSDDDRARQHAEGCARCGAEWAEIGALAKAGRELTSPPSTPERRDAIRATLLSQEAARAASARPRAGWRFAMAPAGAGLAFAGVGFVMMTLVLEFHLGLLAEVDESEWRSLGL